MQILKQSEYFGVQRLELLQRGLSLSEYDYLEPGTPFHYHENPYFMYVIRGNMVDVSRKRASLMPAGSMMFLNWQDAHRTDKHSTRGRGFHLQIDRQWLRQYEVDASLWEGSQLLNHPDFHLVLGKIYYEFRRADNFSALSVEMLVLQLCSMLSNKFSASLIIRPPWMDQLIAILHESSERLRACLKI